MNSHTIHIVNGDSTRELLEQSDLGGRVVTFREAMIDGPIQMLPTPAFIESRSRFLSREYSESIGLVKQKLEEQERALDESRGSPHVVIWVEHDLFCSVHLWYILGRLATGAPAELELVSIGEVASRPAFRGLGELTAAELAQLYPQRTLIDSLQLGAALTLWEAYASDDPELLLRCSDEARLIPFAGESITLHARRYPSRTAGLGSIELEALRLLVGNGATSFLELFRQLQTRIGRYGFGDAQVLSLLRMLTTGEHPLLQIGETSGEISFEATLEGAEVVRGTARAPRSFYHDRWLGGVRLDSSALIYWNDERGAFERT